MFKLEVVDSVEARLAIQVILVILTLIAVQMVWREFHRNKTPFMKYLSLCFAVLFAQAAFMLGVFSYSAMHDTHLPELFMPMLDHLLKVLGFLLLAYAFAFVSRGDKVFSNRILKFNVTALIMATPVVWFFWYQYLSVAPLANQKFGYFWGDLFYEIWTTLLLLYGLFLTVNSSIRMKKAFITGFILFIGKQLLHTANLIWSNNTLSGMLVVERLSPVLFFYVFIMAIYHEIIDEIMTVNKERERLNKEMCASTLHALVSALEVKDYYTRGHARRVSDFSLLVGQRLGLAPQELNDLHLGAMLHDIGKIGVHEDLLNNKGPLKEQELIPVKKHPIDGAAIVEGLENLKHIVPTIKYHHEKWDGSGYPEGFKGNQIPLHARIVAVADAFDAMTSNRAYRSALPVAVAVEELQRGAGHQFDPGIVTVFIDVLLEHGSLGPEKEAAAALAGLTRI